MKNAKVVPGMPDMKDSKALLTLGQQMYKMSIYLIFIGVFGFSGMLIIMGVSEEAASLYLSLCGPDFQVNILMGLCYVLMLIGVLGIIQYFVGIIVIGLGQIVINTSAVDQSYEEQSCEEKSYEEELFTKIIESNRKSSAMKASVVKPSASKPSTSKPSASKPSALSVEIVEAAKRRGNWICASCGTENTKGFGYCEKCGMSK